MNRNCAACRYFNGDPTGGECRKRAPVIGTGAFAQNDAAPYAYWPAVSSNHWCGDFQFKRTEKRGQGETT